MAEIINLLPWRETRRRRLLLTITLSGTGFLLIAIALILALHLQRHCEEVYGELKSDADRQLYATLQRYEQEMRERLRRADYQQQRRLQREYTRSWRQRLLALAALLPEPLWLTKLEYRAGGLTLNGLALNLDAVATLEKRLTAVNGFALSGAGAARRDAQGRWVFSFFLSGDSANGDTD